MSYYLRQALPWLVTLVNTLPAPENKALTVCLEAALSDAVAPQMHISVETDFYEDEMHSSIETYISEVANDLALLELQICCAVLEAPSQITGAPRIARLTHLYSTLSLTMRERAISRRAICCLSEVAFFSTLKPIKHRTQPHMPKASLVSSFSGITCLDLHWDMFICPGIWAIEYTEPKKTERVSNCHALLYASAGILWIVNKGSTTPASLRIP